MGLLADAFSYGDSLKRKVGGLLADPMGTLELGINRIKEDNNNALNLFANAYPMAGDKTVLNTPAQKAAMQKQLADYASTVGMAGIFVGPKSQTWDKAAAAKAQELAQKGTDPRKIWSETGTWKGPDGMWRQEIPDNAAKFSDRAERTLLVREAMGHLDGVKVKSVMQHPELNAAYGLDDLPISLQGKGGSSYSPASWDVESISLGEGGKSPLIHELQHAIQDREGWMRGGSPDASDSLVNEAARKMYADNIDSFQGEGHELLKMARMNAYNRLGGEAEARATQARIPLDAAQRRALFPADSYDVPLDSLILRGMRGN